MSPLWSLIIDGLLAVLLVAAIISCVLVYKKLVNLRDGQAEMKKLVEDLNGAVIEAQRTVGGLKHTAVDAEATLQTQVQKAKALTEELLMITEAGNNLADRIEKGLTSGSKANRADQQSQGAEKKTVGENKSKQNGRQAEEIEPKSFRPEQKELLAALKEAR